MSRFIMTLALATAVTACARLGAGADPDPVTVDAATADPVEGYIDVTAGQERAAGFPLTGFLDSLAGPESARFDAVQGVWFVSNIDGGPQAKDGNGFISRLTADGKLDSLHFVAGGRNGAVLHAPKGMALAGDTLWVADIDAVRAFSARTGEPLLTVDLAPSGAVFLNAITVGPDDAIYVTDTGIRFDERGVVSRPGPNRIYRIAGGEASVALDDSRLGQPNGIAWDEANDRFLVASFGTDTIFEWKRDAETVEPVAVGAGRYDGLVVLDDGRTYVSSWATSAIYELRGNELIRRIADVASPADIGYAPATNTLAVPLLGENRLVLYRVEPGSEAGPR